VDVEVRAPQSVLADLKISDFVATMDLSAVQPGTPTSVPISVTCSSDAVRITSHDPLQQVVHLEEVGTLTLPVEIAIEGQVATGYVARQPVVIPGEVTVEGPRPYLAEVATVTGAVDVNGAREDVVTQVSVVPRDAAGRLVTGLQWSPDVVAARIGVTRRVGYKPDVEVVPDLRGDPAPGYRRGSVSVEPSTVTLAGPSSVLNELPGFVKTLPITITEATEVFTQRTPLTVPASVVVVGVNYVTVTIEILPILGSRTMTDTVEVQGLSQAWVATLSPNEVDVILEGPDTLLAVLTPESIQVFVNLFGLGPGVHRVAPVVLAPQGIRVVSVIPETIEVVIGLPSTPSPTSTASTKGPGS
jgi:YbbR domain-containing protein